MDGEATAPMIASVARTTLSSSDSNQRSSIDRAAPVGTELQEAPAQARQRQQVAGTERPWVGRRLEQGWLDKPRHAFEHRLVTGQGLHIALRELGDLAADELLVRAEQQVATAGEGREGRG